MITTPKLEDRSELPYMGIRSQITIGDLPNVIPQQIGEVAGWLEQRGVAPDGPPLIRYHACPDAPTPDAPLDITIGFPVAAVITGDGRVIAGALPAGRYASLVFTGIQNGIPGNAALVEWAAKEGLRWDSWDEANGEGFAGRLESMLDGPDDDPDPTNWDTEVAIKLADG